MLYELVRSSKTNATAMQMLIELYEPKLRKSLSLTPFAEREDLAQELKCTLIQYIKRYNVDATPGFWEMKEKIKKQKIVE